MRFGLPVNVYLCPGNDRRAFASTMLKSTRGSADRCRRRRRVQFALVALIFLFILALIALLKCKREDIPEVVRALAFWWRGWPRS
jgi:hypothetical protein